MKIPKLTIRQFLFVIIGGGILAYSFPLFALGIVVGAGAALYLRDKYGYWTSSNESPPATSETTRLEKRTSIVTEIRVPVITKMCPYCKSVIEGPVTKCPNCGAALT